MDKLKAKNVLHWIGFFAVVAAAIYIAFVAKGLGIVERVTLAATTLGGLFVALAKLFPMMDKAVDALPDDPPKPDNGPGSKVAAVLILAGGLLLSGAARAQTTELPLIPGTLGCFGKSDTCARLLVPIAMGGVQVSGPSGAGKVKLGVFPGGGAGLGLDFFGKRWHTISPGIAVAAARDTDGATTANIAGIVGVFRVVWVGYMAQLGGADRQSYVLAGVDPLAVAALIGQGAH